MLTKHFAIVAMVALAVLLLATGCERRSRGGDDPSPPGNVTAAGDPAAASPTPPGNVTAAGDPAAASPTPSASSPTAVPPTPMTAACAPLPTGLAAGQTTVRALDIDGVPRTYRLHLPGGVANAANLPVVLNFHGLGSSGAEQEAYSGLVALSDRESFVLVSPDGTGSPRGWVFALSGNTPDDDLAFVDGLLDTLEAELCIDTGRIYATGMSNGAFFSSLLGCLRADSIAAIAPVAGIAWAEGLPCGEPVPVIALHGVQDSVVPFYGGQIFGIIPYDGAPLSIAGWAGHNQCAETAPVQEKLAENVEIIRYEECAAATQLIAVTDGGHTWPGAIPLPRLGPTNREISAAELVWAFFNDKALR